MSPLLAACCSLGCALTWAFATVTFARVMRGHASIAPQALNLVKSAVAFPIFVVVGVASGAGVPAVDAAFGWLALSAVLGLLVADTGYFFALKRLGAARGVLFIPLVPVATTLLAAVALDESLGARAFVGIALTLAGVAIVLAPTSTSTSSSSSSSSLPPGSAVAGVVGGVLYALTQAGANVITKHVLVASSALEVATVRIGIGGLALLVVSAGSGALPGLRPLAQPRLLAAVVVAALVGTVGGIWLGTLGTKHLPVGVATTLAATTPLFALLLARLSGERVSLRAALGAAVAFSGVVVLVL